MEDVIKSEFSGELREALLAIGILNKNHNLNF